MSLGCSLFQCELLLQIIWCYIDKYICWRCKLKSCFSTRNMGLCCR